MVGERLWRRAHGADAGRARVFFQQRVVAADAGASAARACAEPCTVRHGRSWTIYECYSYTSDPVRRYNAGASSNTSYKGESIAYSPNIPWWKEIQAFWVDWASDNPASPSWDWTRDANQACDADHVRG